MISPCQLQTTSASRIVGGYPLYDEANGRSNPRRDLRYSRGLPASRTGSATLPTGAALPEPTARVTVAGRGEIFGGER